MNSYDYDDGPGLDIGMEVTGNKTPDWFTITNTNARSLTPKITSFIDCFKEMETHIAVVTETWLQDGAALEDDVDDLLHCLLYTSPSPRD